jgi:hypothetical protein
MLKKTGKQEAAVLKLHRAVQSSVSGGKLFTAAFALEGRAFWCLRSEASMIVGILVLLQRNLERMQQKSPTAGYVSMTA